MIERYELQRYENGAGCLDVAKDGNYVFFADLKEAAEYLRVILDTHDCHCYYERGEKMYCALCRTRGDAYAWLDQFDKITTT